MNRQEVMMTIRRAGNQFGRVLACLNTTEYVAGYDQAIRDMMRLFSYAPLDADFEEERENLLHQVSVLVKENNELKAVLNEREATIEKLLKHIDIGKVLGVVPRSRRQGVRK